MVDLLLILGFAAALMGVLGIYLIPSRIMGSAFLTSGWAALDQLLTDPGRRREQRLFYGCFALCLIGVFLMGTSLVLGDIDRRNSCIESCRGLGFTDGVIRTSPHSQETTKPSLQCWCQSGDSWSEQPAPIDPESPSPPVR